MSTPYVIDTSEKLARFDLLNPKQFARLSTKVSRFYEEYEGKVNTYFENLESKCITNDTIGVIKVEDVNGTFTPRATSKFHYERINFISIKRHIERALENIGKVTIVKDCSIDDEDISDHLFALYFDQLLVEIRFVLLGIMYANYPDEVFYEYCNMFNPKETCFSNNTMILEISLSTMLFDKYRYDPRSSVDKLNELSNILALDDIDPNLTIEGHSPFIFVLNDQRLFELLLTKFDINAVSSSGSSFIWTLIYKFLSVDSDNLPINSLLRLINKYNINIKIGYGPVLKKLLRVNQFMGYRKYAREAYHDVLFSFMDSLGFFDEFVSNKHNDVATNECVWAIMHRLGKMPSLMDLSIRSIINNKPRIDDSKLYPDLRSLIKSNK